MWIYSSIWSEIMNTVIIYWQNAQSFSNNCNKEKQAYQKIFEYFHSIETMDAILPKSAPNVVDINRYLMQRLSPEKGLLKMQIAFMPSHFQRSSIMLCNVFLSCDNILTSKLEYIALYLQHLVYHSPHVIIEYSCKLIRSCWTIRAALLTQISKTWNVSPQH